MDKRAIAQKRTESGANIFGRLKQRELAEEVSCNVDKIAVSMPERFLESPANASLNGMSSTSELVRNDSMSSGDYVRDHSSILSLQPWVFRKESYRKDEENMRVGGEISGFADSMQTEHSPRSTRLNYGSGKGQSYLRSRRTHRNSIKPFISTENCLIPQLYNESFEFEDYVFSSFLSRAAPKMRPLIITDGNRIISRSGYDPFNSGNPYVNKLHKEVNGTSSGQIDAGIRVPSLIELRKSKRKSRDADRERVDTSSCSQRSCILSHSQGSHDRVFLLCLGISIGVTSTILSSKREIEKVNDLLKDSENLVQDLQEELEMKESMTVKELAFEAYPSKEYLSHDNRSSRNSGFPGHEGDQYDHPKTSEDSGSMSKIEAELEAELERLELNINATNLEGVSVLEQLDSDLGVDIAHGELRADLLNPGAQKFRVVPYGESSSTSTDHTNNPNSGVSPRELSLRLHEVVESRLEERIKELERELQRSQNQLMEAEIALSHGSSDVGSSNQESATITEQDITPDQPFCLELSGDALDAYDEAYQEFMRLADDSDGKTDVDGFRPSDRSLNWATEGGSGDKSSTDADYNERETTWEQVLISCGCNGTEESDGGGDEYEIDEDDGKMIQRIVERTRQGSPVVVHVQRMLLTRRMTS